MKKHILVIDDEEKIRKIYVNLFKASGSRVFEVHQAADGWQAAAVLLSNRVDLILLDLRLPGIDGKELFEVIRNYDSNIKVIIASVYPIHRQKRLVPEADGYFDKSQGMLSLLERVTTTLSETSSLKC